MKFIFRTIALALIGILTFCINIVLFDKLVRGGSSIFLAFILTILVGYGIYVYEQKIVQSQKPKYLMKSFFAFLLLTFIMIVIPDNYNIGPYSALPFTNVTSETTENKKEKEKLTKTEEFEEDFIETQKSMEQILRGKVYDKFEKESLQFVTKTYKLNRIFIDQYNMGSALVYVDESNKNEAAIVRHKLIYVLQVRGELYGEPFNSKYYVAETDILKRTYKFWNKTYDENPMPSIIENNSDDDSYEHQTIYKY